MDRRDLEGKTNEVLDKSALKNKVEREEMDQSILEAWKCICENPDPIILEFGLSMMENGKLPPTEKIVLYLTMLTQLCNSTPLINEPDTKKRLYMALEKIKGLHQAGEI